MSRRLDDTDLQNLLDAAYGGFSHTADIVRLVEEVKWYREQIAGSVTTVSTVPRGMTNTFIPCGKEAGEAIVAALKSPGVLWGPVVIDDIWPTDKQCVVSDDLTDPQPTIVEGK